MIQIIKEHEGFVGGYEQVLSDVKSFLDQSGFVVKSSPGLLQPLFGYPFSPSAGHHVIDKIVISKQEPYLPILKFQVSPDRSLRMYDFDKIGISFRHLSFFETLVFGYAGATENLPKEESVNIFYKLMVDVLGLDKDKIIVSCLGSVEAEGQNIREEEDDVFYQAWKKLLGDKVVKTKGRRNLFYSRVIGNPGGTGCEIYYQIGGKYVEIGSQVNYKFKFTGGLERMRNQAILEGFGLERLLMALENKSNIGETALLKPLKDVVRNFLENNGDKSIDLYDETLCVIADHFRAISFIIYDGQELDGSARGKILRDFIKNFHAQFIYLGIKKGDELLLIGKLFNTLIMIFDNRYQNISKIKSKLFEFIESTIWLGPRLVSGDLKYEDVNNKNK